MEMMNQPQLNNLFETLGANPTSVGLAQFLPLALQAIQNPLEALSGYQKWLSGHEEVDNTMLNVQQYVDMFQKATKEVMDCLHVINGNIKGLYTENEELKRELKEIKEQLKSIET